MTDPAVRPGVRTMCPDCRLAVLMRHCKSKGCEWAECKKCGWTGTTVPPFKSSRRLEDAPTDPEEGE